MSTKTTFKRVALVAVAAMGFGLLSVAPSSAAQQADTLTLSAVTTANSVGAVGTSISTTLTQSFFGNNGDTMSVMAAIVSYPTGFAVAPTLAIVHDGIGGTNAPIGTDRMQLTDTATVSGVVTGATKVSFTPTGVGTYVFSFTPYRGTSAAQALGTSAVASSAAVATWTVTVAAAASAAAADSTSYATLDAGDTVGTGSANAVVVVPVSTSGSAVAVIRVLPLVNAATATGSTTLVATIAGPGSLRNVITAAQAAASGARSVTTTGSNGTFFVYVYGDNTPGTSTITLTMGTVVLTKTVKFYGAAASVTATLVTPVIAAGSTAATGVVTAVVKDAAGNPVPGASLWLISGTPTVFASATSAVVTSGSTGKASFNITGLTAGTSTVTLQSVSGGSTALFPASTPVSVRVGSNVASSVTMTLDKATYSQGEAAVLTVTVKDAAGNLVADGTNTIFDAAVTSTRVVTGSLPSADHVTSGSANGTLTYKINVPTTSGAFTISGIGNTDNLAAAQAGLAISVTATVSQTAAEIANADAIAAAADAAAEATDAANAATDAANAAAEAADAATAAAQDAADAVATLGTQVAELVADLKAQIAAQKAAITALTNLVIKIQKKLKA